MGKSLTSVLFAIIRSSFTITTVMPPDTLVIVQSIDDASSDDPARCGYPFQASQGKHRQQDPYAHLLICPADCHQSITQVERNLTAPQRLANELGSVT